MLNHPHTIPTLARMPEALITLCCQFSRVTRYQANEIIFQRGEKQAGLSIVLSGTVEVGNYGIDGRFYVSAEFTRGDTFGEFTLFAQLPRTHQTTALSQVEVLHLSPRQYQAVRTHSADLDAFLLSSLACKLHITLERLDDKVRLPTHVQLAKMLYHTSLQQRHKVIKIRQQDCASRLGVTVLSAHQSIKKLVALGLINKAYGAIIIEDPEALAEWLESQASLLSLTSAT
jgi:CRP-like cAMP-binding protein